MNHADRQLFNLGLFISVIAVLGAAIAGGELDAVSEDDGPANGDVEPTVFEDSTSGQLSEGGSADVEWDSGYTATVGTFILTWNDEDDLPLHENYGDEFTLRVVAPDGTEDSETFRNEHGEQGRIIITIDFIEELGYKGPWWTTVTLEDAGDQQWLGIGPDPLIGDDDSNEYTLTVEIQYRDD